MPVRDACGGRDRAGGVLGAHTAEVLRCPSGDGITDRGRGVAHPARGAGRKNHLFAGSDGGAERSAVIASLLETAKLNRVEPYAYLKDVLDRMTNGHPMSRIEDLLPWNWSPSIASE